MFATALTIRPWFFPLQGLKNSERSLRFLVAFGGLWGSLGFLEVYLAVHELEKVSSTLPDDKQNGFCWITIQCLFCELWIERFFYHLPRTLIFVLSSEVSELTTSHPSCFQSELFSFLSSVSCLFLTSALSSGHICWYSFPETDGYFALS